MTSNQWNTSFIYLDRCLLCNLQAPWKPWNVFVRLSNNCWNLSTHNLELERQRVRDKNFICWGCVTKNPKIFRSKWEQNNRGIVNAKENNWELLPSFQAMTLVKKAPVLQNFPCETVNFQILMQKIVKTRWVHYVLFDSKRVDQPVLHPVLSLLKLRVLLQRKPLWVHKMAKMAEIHRNLKKTQKISFDHR